MFNLSKTVTLLLSSTALAQHNLEQMGPDNSYKPGAYFEYKTVIIPGDSKVDRGGEDAADGTDTMLMVADGVGGWSLSGVDPGFFSRKLTSSAIEHHLKNPTAGPLDVL